jgi:hypothetical protein
VVLYLARHGAFLSNTAYAALLLGEHGGTFCYAIAATLIFSLLYVLAG